MLDQLNSNHANGRLDTILANAKAARAAYEQLRDTALITPVRKLAAAALPHLNEQALITDFYTHHAQSGEGVFRRLTPYVSCVEPTTDGGFIARFSYVNPNPGSKYVAVGLGNRVEPEPKDAGQPVQFRMIALPEVFGVASDGAPVTWHLEDQGATATLDPSLPRCKPDNRYSVAPVADCVRRDDDGLFVSFGYESWDTLPRFIDGKVYLPGRQRHAMETKVKGDTATWSIGGVATTVSGDYRVRCKR